MGFYGKGMGKLWGFMETFGNLWKHYENLWESSGNLWKRYGNAMENYGNVNGMIWKIMKT